MSSDSQNITIIGTISKLVLCLYIINAIVTVTLFVLIFYSFTTFQSKPINAVLIEALYTIVMFFTLYTFTCPFRLSFKTVMQGSLLTTYSILGKKTINLQELTSTKRVWIIITRSGSIYALKLFTLHGSLYLQLGSIPKDQRKRLYTAIEPYIFNSNVKQDKWTNQTFQNWWPAEHYSLI